jgi:hypothetical protein
MKEGNSGYNSKIYTQVDGKTCLFEIIIFFLGKLTYVLEEEDTKIIMGIPKIYNENRNIKQQMATG